MLNFVFDAERNFEGRDNEMISDFFELGRSDSTAANGTDSLQHSKLEEIAI
jgi:hypothetical protein